MKQTKLNFFKNKPSLDTPLTTPNSCPAYKSRPMKPLLSTQLVTSTPDSHQISKRIKGLLGYSEHYKGNRIDYPVIGPCFSPLQARNYRKARELTLEIWDPMIQISFLEKFLKGLKNLQILRIEVLTKKYHKGEILKRLCGILSKNSGLARVHIDFVKEQRKQVLPGLSKRVKSIRELPKLKNLDITVAGQQVIPFSMGLEKVGFGNERGFEVEDTSVIQNLMQRTPKVYQLDTIRIESEGFYVLPHNLWESLIFVISKLPNFRELDFTFSKELYLPLEQIFPLLDALMKAPKFEILRTGLQIGEISFLEHPLLKSKSLKRTHLSLFLQEISLEELKRISDLLQEIPSLYELSLYFSPHVELNDETVEDFMKKISGMTCIRKLRIIFENDSGNLSEKQAGSIFRWIFNEMMFLEELGLVLPQNCFNLSAYNGRQIQGLPRLKKALIQMIGLKAERENDLRRMLRTLQQSHQLREFVLDMRDSLCGYLGVINQLTEGLKKWKELQVFGLDTSTDSKITNSGFVHLKYFVRTCDRMRNLQDLTLVIGLNLHPLEYIAFEPFHRQFKMNQKYRHRCLVLDNDEEQDDEEQDDGQQQDNEEQDDEEQDNEEQEDEE